MYKSPSEIITRELFFRLYFSYLLRSKDFNYNYDLLIEQYNLCPDSFKILNKYDLLKLKQIQDDKKNDKYSLFSGTLDFSEELSSIVVEEKKKEKHKDLCDNIVKEKDTILQKIFSRPITYCSREHPTRFGPIDIVIEDDDSCAYIIEVKTETAQYQIVSQASKYFIGLSLKLNLGFFNRVEIITMAPGYKEETLRGLQQIGAKPLLIYNNPLKIKEI